jgi:hypothetical protein
MTYLLLLIILAVYLRKQFPVVAKGVCDYGHARNSSEHAAAWVSLFCQSLDQVDRLRIVQK